MLHGNLNSESNLSVIKPSQSDKPQLMLSRQQSNGRKVEILIDERGALIGKITQGDEVVDARIKGLPSVISSAQQDKLKEYLHYHSNINIFADDIIIDPKLKGGEPITLAVAALVGGVISAGSIAL